MHNLYADNDKTLIKEIKDYQNNLRNNLFHGLEKSVLLKFQYCSILFKDSMQFQYKYHPTFFFFRNRDKLISKFTWKGQVSITVKSIVEKQ